MSRGHGGNLNALAARAGRPPSELLDFSANVNPLGPPAWLRPLISRGVESLGHYPDPDAAPLVAAIAARHGVPPEQVIAGNGSSELLYALPKALDAGRALIPVPSYIDYPDAARAAELHVRAFPLNADFALDLDALAAELSGDEVVILGQPNNPTGRLLDAAALRRVAAEHPDTAFIVDEAFADFVEGMDTLIDDRPANVAVVRSMTKFYAIPGLRLGYAVADAALIERLRSLIPAWTVNALAQSVGQAALADDDYARRTRAFIAEQRESLAEALRGVPGLTVTPGVANYLLVRTEDDARDVADRLLRDHGIAIRVCDNYEGLDEHAFRVAVRTESENARLLAALRPRATKPARRRTPALMVQGTTSNAGKSVLAAALCRILLQDGVRVAPFKSQNMSLNSFVTRDGREMGRAQVVQAQACRLDPDVRMNPVLLKPTSETGSQVIVRGTPVSNMDVAGYTAYKPQAFAAAKECYDSLAADFDAVVLEGAGSPAEVNLKHHDIVNMRMAAYAEAPVLLAGDIDRGGVYAAFVGTLEVLEEWERALVRGFIVNRFRGDPSLLGPAHDYVLRHTGRPVLGVVPYLDQLGLPQEDSVEFKSGALDAATSADGAVDIAVIDLPHISNFTDFDPLRIEPDVRLRVVRTAGELGTPDAVILPGSKNVIGDLAHLKRTGLAEGVARLEGAEIVGICGGLQMLGSHIADPHRLESTAGAIAGLGLLPVTTVLAAEKTLVRVEATHVPSSLPVHGYEIHHGQTTGEGLEPAFRRQDGQSCGVGAADGRIWGTYLHGVFDADPFRRWFIDRLRERRGLAPLGAVQATYDLEPAFERLAEMVRASLDMDAVYRLMGL